MVGVCGGEMREGENHCAIGISSADIVSSPLVVNRVRKMRRIIILSFPPRSATLLLFCRFVAVVFFSFLLIMRKDKIIPSWLVVWSSPFIYCRQKKKGKVVFKILPHAYTSYTWNAYLAWILRKVFCFPPLAHIYILIIKMTTKVASFCSILTVLKGSQRHDPLYYFDLKNNPNHENVAIPILY